MRSALVFAVLSVGWAGSAARVNADKLGSEPAATPQPTETPENAPVAKPAPTPGPFLPDDRVPFPAGTKPMDAAPEMPATTAPVVFMAAFHGDNGTTSREATSFRRMLKTALQANTDKKLLLNMIPDRDIHLPYEREDKPNLWQSHTRPEFLKDAQIITSDVYVDGEVTTASSGGIRVHLFCQDLHTSKTFETTLEKPVDQFRDLFTEATRFVAKSCGVTDADITESNMLKGLPGPPTWQWMLSPTWRDEIDTSIAQDPDILILYDYALQEQKTHDGIIKYANEGLKRFPNDWRIVYDKAVTLASATERDYAALVLHSQLVQRYPTCFVLLRQYPFTLDAAYSSNDATDAPLPYIAAAKVFEKVVERYPRNWGLHYAYAKLLDRLGWFVRGPRTVDMIPEGSMEFFAMMTAGAAKEIRKAAEMRGDCPELWQDVIDIHFSAGIYELEAQRWALDKVHELDPDNVKAEMIVAFSHSAGWDDPRKFLPLIRESIQRHSTNTQALNRIAWRVGMDIERNIGFKVKTKDQMYKQHNPESDLFVELEQKTIAEGYEPELWTAQTLWKVMDGQGRTTDVEALATSGKAPLFSKVGSYYVAERGDYAACERYARAGLKTVRDKEYRDELRGNLAYALAKQKKCDEAFKLSEEGIKDTPDRSSFFYTYALAAVECGTNLDKAREYFKRGLAISPGDKVLLELQPRLEAASKADNSTTATAQP